MLILFWIFDTNKAVIDRFQHYIYSICILIFDALYVILYQSPQLS